MGKLTDLQLRNLQGKASESVGSRGDGALLFWKRASGNVEAYYRYRNKGDENLIKVGQYKITKSSHGYTLAECRDKAQELARTRRECGGDLKGYLEAELLKQNQAAKELKAQAQIEASQGSLQQLCDNYIASLRNKNKKKSEKDVRNALNKHVHRAFPELSKTKARDITSDDIVKIIRRIIEGGGTTIANRVRSYLHSSFAYGIKADNDPMEQVHHNTRFHIEHNPVANVTSQKAFEYVRERTLSHAEVKKFWYGFDHAMGRCSPVFGLLLKLMLSTGGNRPEQLIECKWSDVDFERRTLTFMDGKGRGEPRKRVMPLTPRSMQILYDLRDISGSFEWIFTIRGSKPISETTLGVKVGRYCNFLEVEARAKGEKAPERFTPKDFRRTATSLLIECRVPREQRYLIQSREDGSIESKHYDHSDRLPEKREALKKYDAFLDKILKGENVKVVDLEQYKQSGNKA
ncbi:hypothetical protein GZ77_14820 [Endozoicomonas montiporae]|uniref:Tyr recombinase domain-containing protein n=2 Tax=Endozoicomonas montiporae TaxID=1027273 RepID=A0A081N566_9GAMM|nr:integrase family protein [Endozoicomonas montiporae]AMO57531.1 hypothetical protein EZMO1_3550 [Endozoicomonas montiporae CL-33]KEQ13589.1 hypothetical protein GZ77_14820 [Endozoicomonas montiporae]